MSLVPARRPGWLLELRCKSGTRGMAEQTPLDCGDGQNPAYRPSGEFRRCERNEAVPRGGSGLLRRFTARNDVSGRLDGKTEEIGRLGIPALAVLWRQGTPCGEVAPMRPRGLQ